MEDFYGAIESPPRLGPPPTPQWNMPFDELKAGPRRLARAFHIQEPKEAVHYCEHCGDRMLRLSFHCLMHWCKDNKNGSGRHFRYTNGTWASLDPDDVNGSRPLPLSDVPPKEPAEEATPPERHLRVVGDGPAEAAA